MTDREWQIVRRALVLIALAWAVVWGTIFLRVGLDEGFTGRALVMQALLGLQAVAALFALRYQRQGGYLLIAAAALTLVEGLVSAIYPVVGPGMSLLVARLFSVAFAIVFAMWALAAGIASTVSTDH